MTSNWLERSKNINPMWKVLNKEVDLGELTSFIDHVYLGCTQRQCEISKEIVDNYKTTFESRISAGATENYHVLKNLRISSWSYDRRAIILHLPQARLLHQLRQHQVTVRLEKERIEVRVILLQCLCQLMLIVERCNPLRTKPIKIQKTQERNPR